MPSLGMNLHGASFRCQATAAVTEFAQEIQLFSNPNLSTTSHGRPYVSMAMGQTGSCSPQVPAKPLNEGELCDWIANALVGESIQYHEGLLFIDRSATTSTLTTQQRNPDGSYAVAEALTFVPGVRLAPDINSGRRLVTDNPNDFSEDG